MRWPWRRRNNEAAKQAAEQAAEAKSKAERQTGRVDRVAERAQELADRSSWFAQDMERALHLRRGSP